MVKEETELIKSPNDKNEYRYIKLDNELEIVLVSDPITDFASCCLSVGVGSLSNPDNIDGLAHFLEHMLFLGTEKYPIEKEFVDFISKNSGTYNASTAANKTKYYYKVPSFKLKESLDRFSSFFVSPLMNEDAVERELNAVDSEHNNNKQSDHWRIDRMINDQFEGHPISNFSTGNKKSLQIDGIRDKVVEFYNQYYSANIMKVAIYGKESLDELEVLAREYFSDIKNKNVESPSFNTLSLKQPVWLECESKLYDLIKLIFPIPDTSITLQEYKDQSVSIFSHILGHESEGSLFSVLKELNYATGLSFGAPSIAKTINKLEFTIFLTPLGIKNIDEIIGLTLQYCDNVQFPKYCYDEKKLISEINWSKFQKSDPQSVTTTISDHLFKVESPSHVLKYNHFWSEFAPEKMEKLRSFIRPDNMVSLLFLKSFNRNEETKVEKHYGINFNKRSITQDDINKWRSIPKNNKLYVPLPNPFIPNDFSIKVPQDQKNCIPEVVYKENGILIHHSIDRRFNSPKARVYIKFLTPLFGSAYGLVLANFIKKSLKTVLNEKILYYLTVLEYEMKLTNYVNYFELSSYGYSDKIFLALEEVFKFFYSFDLTDEQFETIRVKVHKRISQGLLYSPYLLAGTEINMFTLNSNGPTSEKLEIVKDLSKENFIAHVKSFFGYLNMDVLIVGNITKEEAQSFGKTLNSFKRIKLASGDGYKLHRVRLPQDKETHLKKEIQDKEQTNCGCTTLLLIGEDNSIKNRAITSFLYQILYRAYFDELRTKQQFGYVVSVSSDFNGSIYGLRLIVQSHTKTPEDIYNATNQFLIDFSSELDELEKDPETFNALIEALQNSYEAKTYNNRGQATLYWNNYNSSGSFTFNIEMSKEFGKLTFQEIRQAYNDYILPSSSKRRVFVVNLYPSSMEFSTSNTIGKDNINVILQDTHNEFRLSNGYFPNSISIINNN